MKSTNTEFKILPCLFFLFALSANVTAQSGDVRVKEEIIAANKKFEQVFTSSGGIGLAALYAKHAMILPPNSPMIGEADGIGKFWKAAFDAGVKRVTLETLTIESFGNSANEVGKFILYDSTDKLIDSGKYLVFWKNDKDGWKLYRDIWNSSQATK